MIGPGPQIAGAAALAFAAGLAVVWLSRLPGETRLIDRYAQAYQRDTGNPARDCYGRPSPVEGVRLYVICRPRAGTPVVYLLNARGRRMDLPTLEAIVRRAETRPGAGGHSGAQTGAAGGAVGDRAGDGPGGEIAHGEATRGATGHRDRNRISGDG